MERTAISRVFPIAVPLNNEEVFVSGRLCTIGGEQVNEIIKLDKEGCTYTLGESIEALAVKQVESGVVLPNGDFVGLIHNVSKDMNECVKVISLSKESRF